MAFSEVRTIPDPKAGDSHASLVRHINPETSRRVVQKAIRAGVAKIVVEDLTPDGAACRKKY